MLFSRELSKFAFNLFLFNFPQNYKKKKSLLLVTSYMIIITKYGWKLSALKIYCLNLMSVCKQLQNGSDLPFVILFGFQWKFVGRRSIAKLRCDSKPHYLQSSCNLKFAWWEVLGCLYSPTKVTLSKTFLPQGRKGGKDYHIRMCLSSWKHNC